MKKINRQLAILLVVALALCVDPAFADRGMMPANPSVSLFEPKQNAVIAWNGEEEILVLTTDVYASQEVNVLEVLPLPSQPKVTKGDFKILENAINVINKHRKRYSTRGGFKGLGTKGMGDGEHVELPPAGKITFHEKIGHHEISVTQVLNRERFVEWVEKSLQKMGGKKATVPAWMKPRIERYLKDGYNWFAFDSVRLGTTPKSSEPIKYRFKTSKLFYPLKITQVAAESTAQLVILTSQQIKWVSSLYPAVIHYPSDTYTVSKEETDTIDGEMSSLLRSKEGDSPIIGIWQVDSYRRGFTQDLLADFKLPKIAQSKKSSK